jgi:hypoxanthine phosphoribosyltransferase
MTKKNLIFSEQVIRTRIRELGAQLTEDYRGRQLVVVGVLNGVFIFLADLVRVMDLSLKVDFLRAASYGCATVSSGQVVITKEIELPLAGKDVLVVEDIVDTGCTLAALVTRLQEKRPNSLKVCVLIDKKERREVEVRVDYVGFDVAEGFLVGYGLDCAEQYRNLPAIYHLQEAAGPASS